MAICFSSGIWVLVLSTILISWTTSFDWNVLFRNSSLNSFAAAVISSDVLFSSERFLFKRASFHMLIAMVESEAARLSVSALFRNSAAHHLFIREKGVKDGHIDALITQAARINYKRKSVLKRWMMLESTNEWMDKKIQNHLSDGSGQTVKRGRSSVAVTA